MALQSKSLFLYGFEVTQFNCNLSFKNDALGSTINTTLNFGFYSLDSLMTEVVRAMNEADTGASIYTYTIDRTINGGTESRVTISTTGAYLLIDFSVAASCGLLMGYNAAIYSGATSYTSATSPGTSLIPERIGFTYLGPEFDRKVQGAVNISAAGEKEAVIFAIQKFISVEFKFEPTAKVISEWEPFLSWAIQQRTFEFTPQISSPNTVYQVTLDKTSADGKGLAYRMVEQLPEFPFAYRTGMLTMRQKQSSTFII